MITRHLVHDIEVILENSHSDCRIDIVNIVDVKNGWLVVYNRVPRRTTGLDTAPLQRVANFVEHDGAIYNKQDFITEN